MSMHVLTIELHWNVQADLEGGGAPKKFLGERGPDFTGIFWSLCAVMKSKARTPILAKDGYVQVCRCW